MADLIMSNERYTPTKSIGYQVLLGTEGTPRNRLMLAVAKPYQGKSTMFFSEAANQDRQGNLVELIETENGLDAHYMASYFKHVEPEGGHPITFLLEFYTKLLNNQVKELDGRTAPAKKKNPMTIEVSKELLSNALEAYEKDDSKVNGEKVENFEKILEILKTSSRVQLLQELVISGEYPYPKSKVVLSGQGVTQQEALKNIRDARAQFRLQRVKITQDIRSFEKLEEYFEKNILAPRRDNRGNAKTHLLVIIDSLTGLFPEKDLEKDSSSDGNAFGTAKYLHQWIPKIYQDLKRCNISLAITCQLNDKIKMSMFDKSDEIADAVFRGGSQLKFAASLIFVIERMDRGSERLDGTKSPMAAKVKCIKAKQRGGAKDVALKAEYQILTDELGNNTLDFDEPFYREWIKNAHVTDPAAGVFAHGSKLSVLVEAARYSDHWEEGWMNKTKPLGELTKAPQEIIDIYGEDALFIEEYTKNVAPLLKNEHVRQVIRDTRHISMEISRQADSIAVERHNEPIMTLPEDIEDPEVDPYAEPYAEDTIETGNIA